MLSKMVEMSKKGIAAQGCSKWNAVKMHNHAKKYSKAVKF